MSLRQRQYPAFTLVELLVATVIGVLVVVVAIATFRSVSRSRETARYYSEMMAQGRYALDQIRDDLANFYRSAEPQQMRLVGIKGGTIEQPADRLIIYAVQDRPIKEKPGESDIYEVEYGLTINKKSPYRMLARRCAALDHPGSVVSGGILTRIMQPMHSLEFEYFDGSQWLRQWDSREGFPFLVRISLELANEKDKHRTLLFTQEVSLEPLSQGVNR